jgi:hypothetical protein
VNGAEIPFDQALCLNPLGWAGSTRRALLMAIQVKMTVAVDAAKCLWAIAAIVAMLI